MPSSYAHYRFGTQIIPMMPADVRGPILRHRALFDIGLHGPDFLFYHHFLKVTPLFRLGSVYHGQSGIEFFTRCCDHLRQHPSEAAFAYLHGLLAHYCLDSACHPLVYSMTDDTDLGHGELETEFDRYLMALDGIKKPHETNISRHMQLRKDEFEVVAGFYPDVTEKETIQCIRNMALALRLLTIPTAPGHAAVVAFTKAAGKVTAGKVMTVGPNPRCDHLDKKLLELYEQALAKFPAYLEQLNQHMAYGEPFGDDFKVNFDRG